MHKSRKPKIAAEAGKKARRSSILGKTAVFGVLDRDFRQVRCKVIPNVKRETLQNEILNSVDSWQQVYTDEFVGYDR